MSYILNDMFHREGDGVAAGRGGEPGKKGSAATDFKLPPVSAPNYKLDRLFGIVFWLSILGLIARAWYIVAFVN